MIVTTKTRDELAAEGLELVHYLACQHRNLPPGINRDDLVSVGNEAVVEALQFYDPACGVSFKTCCKTTIRSRMIDAIRAAQRHSRKRVGLEETRPDGERSALPADPKAEDPAVVAQAREKARRVKTRTTVTDLATSLPAPEDVAQRVLDLRAAMFAAVKPEDIREVMSAVVAQAQNGNLRAAKLLIDLLGPSSGVTVQTAIVQTTSEEG
jgi:RNA polymerase sigma factor (sigma-70 family)